MEVYLLWHTHDPDEEVDIKILGVYSSEQKAIEARERAKNLPGFRGNPESFHIDCYVVDQHQWTEGYITVRWEQ